MTKTTNNNVQFDKDSFWNACKEGDLKYVKNILKQARKQSNDDELRGLLTYYKQGYSSLGASVNIGNAEIVKAILNSTKNRDPKLLETILTQTAQSSELSPLYEATELQRVEIIKIIIEFLKENSEFLERILNQAIKTVPSICYYAASAKKTESIKAIFESVKDNSRLLETILTKTDNNGFSPLAIASFLGNTESIKVIIESVKDNPVLLEKILLQAPNVRLQVLTSLVMLGNDDVMNVISKYVPEIEFKMPEGAYFSNIDQEYIYHIDPIRKFFKDKKELGEVVFAQEENGQLKPIDIKDISLTGKPIIVSVMTEDKEIKTVLAKDLAIKKDDKKNISRILGKDELKEAIRVADANNISKIILNLSDPFHMGLDGSHAMTLVLNRDNLLNKWDTVLYDPNINHELLELRKNVEKLEKEKLLQGKDDLLKGLEVINDIIKKQDNDDLVKTRDNILGKIIQVDDLLNKIDENQKKISQLVHEETQKYNDTIDAISKDTYDMGEFKIDATMQNYSDKRLAGYCDIISSIVAASAALGLEEELQQYCKEKGKDCIAELIKEINPEVERTLQRKLDRFKAKAGVLGVTQSPNPQILSNLATKEQCSVEPKSIDPQQKVGEEVLAATSSAPKLAPPYYFISPTLISLFGDQKLPQELSALAGYGMLYFSSFYNSLPSLGNVSQGVVDLAKRLYIGPSQSNNQKSISAITFNKEQNFVQTTDISITSNSLDLRNDDQQTSDSSKINDSLNKGLFNGIKSGVISSFIDSTLINLGVKEKELAKSGLMIALTAVNPQTAIAAAIFDLSTRYIANQPEQDRFVQAVLGSLPLLISLKDNPSSQQIANIAIETAAFIAGKELTKQTIESGKSLLGKAYEVAQNASSSFLPKSGNKVAKLGREMDV